MREHEREENSRRKIEQSFAAERSLRAVESVANCVGPMLTHRKDGAKTRCKRKIGSAHSPVPLILYPPQCIPTIRAAVFGNVPGGRRMHNAWHARVSFFVVAYFKSQLPHGLGRTGLEGDEGDEREKRLERLPRYKTWSLSLRHETHSRTWSRKLPSFLRDFYAMCQFHNVVAFFQHPFPSHASRYAKILIYSLVKMSIPVSLVFFWALKYGHSD